MDPYSAFLKAALKRIEFLEFFFKDEMLYSQLIAKLIYSMKLANYETDGLVAVSGEACQAMQIIYEGQVEYFT